MNGLLKLVGTILVWGSLAVAAVSTATLYLVPVSKAADNPEIFKVETAIQGEDTDAVGPNGYLKTRAPAGPKVARDGGLEPLFPAGTELTPEIVARMVGDDPNNLVVRRVKVAEFSFARWSHLPHFIGAVVMLVAGGLLLRVAGRPGAALDTAADGGSSPTFAVSSAREAVATLLRDVPEQEDLDEALRMLSDRLGELQQSHLASFADARDVLIGRFGLGGFARIMDRFAAAERQINRAWSAASDARIGSPVDAPELLGESLHCLETASLHLDELADMLKIDVNDKL